MISFQYPWIVASHRLISTVALVSIGCSVPLIRGAAADHVDVKFEEWSVPDGAFPHDPAAAPDGRAWYTGQHNSTLGRLDPATGEIKSFSLPTPNSGPHGLVADKEGNIWYTGNAAALIGKLDP